MSSLFLWSVLGKELSTSPETFLTTAGTCVMLFVTAVEDPRSGLLLLPRFLAFWGAMDRHNAFFLRTNIGWRYEPGVCPFFPEVDSLVNP
jgi:hypothetical protein